MLNFLACDKMLRRAARHVRRSRRRLYDVAADAIESPKRGLAALCHFDYCRRLLSSQFSLPAAAAGDDFRMRLPPPGYPAASPRRAINEAPLASLPRPISI